MSDIATTICRAERAAIINILRAKPDVSLSDLRLLRLRGRFGEILGTLTIREVWSGVPDETIDPITGEPDKLARRQRYDDEVIAALQEAAAPLSAEEVAERIGGSSQDARIALQRLARERRARRTLAGRATKYVAT
ncbi:MAG: hypothetical protein H6712_25900 [Myxococcales bacterium]|nr:hypothetical protein [Myxococcales bacterium]MCB9717309.1 hypothetical protein [Myxococcales bacterium]